MLNHLLKNSDWAFLLDFVSPSFFKVIPPLELMSNATALAKRTRDKTLFQESVKSMSEHFGRVLPNITIEAGAMTHAPGKPQQTSLELKNLDELRRREVATRIVEIYFAQILSRKTVLLDVRLSRFSHQEAGLLWTPAPLLGSFSDDFLSSMGELYKGYYGSNSVQMKKALKDIGLDWAYDVFLAHFGEGDQSEVRFTMAHFVHTFHQIFMMCKSERKSLKGEFVQLGVILGLMYESLETLNVSVDVRSAFFRVLKNPDTDSDLYP